MSLFKHINEKYVLTCLDQFDFKRKLENGKRLNILCFVRLPNRVVLLYYYGAFVDNLRKGPLEDETTNTTVHWCCFLVHINITLDKTVINSTIFLQSSQKTYVVRTLKPTKRFSLLFQ